MKIKQLLEAKYARDSSWMDSDTFAQGTVALQYVRENKKILDQLFKEIKSSFRGFHHHATLVMEEDPENFGGEDYNPKQIAEYWLDQSIDSFAFDDESVVYNWLSKRTNKQMLDDIVSAMGQYVVDNAQEFADEAN